MFIKNNYQYVAVATSLLITIQTVLAVRMTSARKASDMVPHLALQIIALVVWASTGITSGLMILYEIVFKGVPESVFLHRGITSATMGLFALIILNFFVIVQGALAEMAGGRAQ